MNYTKKVCEGLFRNTRVICMNASISILVIHNLHARLARLILIKLFNYTSIVYKILSILAI